MSFGADTDIVGLSTDTDAPGWKLQSCTKAVNREVADAEDSHGDYAESKTHSVVTERQVTYVRTSDAAILLYDTATGVDYRLGKVVNGYVIRSWQLDTSKEKPRLVGTVEVCGLADSQVGKFPVTDLHLASAASKAHKLGFTVAAGNKLLSSSITAEAQLSREWDEDSSDTVWLGIKAGRVTVTGNFVGVTAAASATADTGWQLQGGPSDDRDRAAYGTGSIQVFKNLARAT
jgi:hypothetical protein